MSFWRQIQLCLRISHGEILALKQGSLTENTSMSHPQRTDQGAPVALGI